MAGENRKDWKRVVMIALGAGVGVGLVFGVLGAVFEIEVPGPIIGATGGVIFGTLIASRKANSTEWVANDLCWPNCVGPVSGDR